MRNITATEAVRSFSEVIDNVQEEAVTIERNGRPVAVVYSHARAMELEALELEAFEQIKNEVLEELKGK